MISVEASERHNPVGIFGLRSIGTALGMVIAAGLLIFIYLNDPAKRSILPPCPFHAITGLYCPGCGSTRAVHQLMHGNLLRALDLNPLMVLALPFLAWSELKQAIKRPTTPTRPFWIWLILAVILVYWVLRNIPTYPLTLLAP